MTGYFTAVRQPLVLATFAAAVALVAPGGALAQGAAPQTPPITGAVPPETTATEPDATAASPAQPGETASPAEATPETAAPDPAAGPAPDLGARLEQMESALAAQQAEIEALREKAEEAELAALMADDDVEVEQDPLRLYGFMDFGVDKFFFTDDDDSFALLRPTKTSSFVFGNLNLYVDAAPAPDWRALFELRFTLAPHGEETQLGPPLGSSYQRVDNLAFDFASPSSQSQLRLGGLFIERAWVEYTYNDLLQVRTGMFLNPFGIWNVDHGSPTLISLMLPTFVAAQMMPSRLLGVQARGSWMADGFEYGYRLHVSNGRGPTDYDLSGDKALGGRLFVAHEGNYGRTVLGGSTYVGTYRDQQKTIALEPGNTFDWETTVQYDERLFAGDVAIDAFDFRFRSEAVFRQVEYDGAQREQVFNTSGETRYLANRLEYNVYALLAYRLPWWGLEPYAEYEVMAKSFVLPRYAGNARATESDSAAVLPSVGLNVGLSSHTQLKLQYAVVYLMDQKLEETYFRTPIFFSRLVTSF